MSDDLKTKIEQAPEYEGPYEKWLLGPGFEYDIAGLQLGDRSVMSCVAEVRKPAIRTMFAPGQTETEFVFPRLWREDVVRHGFVPFLLKQALLESGEESPEGGREGRFRQKVDAQFKSEELVFYRMNLPLPVELLNPAFPPVAGNGGIVLMSQLGEVDLLDLANVETPGPPLVILAIIDDGIPFAHQAFRDARTGRTRIAASWNQSTRGQGETRVPFGRVFTADQIDQLIAKHGSDENALYRGAGVAGIGGEAQPLDRTWTHGAHTLGLMAGNWPAESAAQAPIIAVDLPSRAHWETSGFGKDCFILAAIHFIFEQADLLAERAGQTGVPLILNISYGTTGGARDGNGLLEAAIAELVEARRLHAGPTIATLPAGNAFDSRLHAIFKSEALDKEPQSIDWQVLPGDRTSSYLEIWHPADAEPDDHEVSLHLPGGELILSLAIKRPLDGENGIEPSYTIERSQVADRPFLQYAVELYRGLRWRSVICLAPTAPANPDLPAAPTGAWRIEVKRIAANATADIRLSILRDDVVGASPVAGRQSLFVGSDDKVTGFGSLNGIASGEGVLRVAGHVAATGEAAPYSSAGSLGSPVGVHASAPSERSGALPGVVSIGSRSGSRYAASGTSAASPQLARALALAIQNGGDASNLTAGYFTALLPGAAGKTVQGDPAHPAGPASVARLGAIRIG